MAGSLAVDGRGRHGNHVKGSRHSRWNEGRIIGPRGYVLVRVGATHPLADPNGYCREHILIMCASIGRMLKPDEVVHHINGDRQDNRIENLLLMSNAEHSRMHCRGRVRDATGRFAREAKL